MVLFLSTLLCSWAEERVILRAGALLRVSPESAASSVKNENARVFSLIQDQGDWLQLQTLPISTNGCIAPYLSPSHYQLRFWVKRGDLERVLTREVSYQTTDGAMITVGAGALAQPSPVEGRFHLVTQHITVDLPVSTDAVGLKWTVVEPSPQTWTGQVALPESWVLGDTTVQFVWPAAAYREETPGTVVFGADCTRISRAITLTPDMKVVAEGGVEGGVAVGTVGGETTKSYEVPSGTPVYWPETQTVFGEVAYAFTLTGATDAGKYVCEESQAPGFCLLKKGLSVK